MKTSQLLDEQATPEYRTLGVKRYVGWHAFLAMGQCLEEEIRIVGADANVAVGINGNQLAVTQWLQSRGVELSHGCKARGRDADEDVIDGHGEMT